MDNQPPELLPPVHPSKLTEAGNPRLDFKDRFGFEQTTIRMFAPDSQDLKSLENIRDDQEAQRRLLELEDMTNQDLLDWAVEPEGSKRQELMIAVDSHDNQPGGFVFLYRQHWTRQHRMAENHIDPLPPKGTLDLEISTGRNPEEAQVGLISSGIRQTCLRMMEIMFNQGHTPENIGLRIVAYIEPDNANSIRAFEKAGFTKRGNMPYEKESPSNDEVYILNWNKLDELFHQKSATNLGKEFVSVKNDNSR